MKIYNAETREHINNLSCIFDNLPNPYETYSGITKQEGHYEKCLDNYTDVDLVEDKKYDKRFD